MSSRQRSFTLDATGTHTVWRFKTSVNYSWSIPEFIRPSRYTYICSSNGKTPRWQQRVTCITLHSRPGLCILRPWYDHSFLKERCTDHAIVFFDHSRRFRPYAMEHNSPGATAGTDNCHIPNTNSLALRRANTAPRPVRLLSSGYSKRPWLGRCGSYGNPRTVQS
jgi:hypothetical protein